MIDTFPRLTAAQIAEYHDQGYVVVPDVFPREELDLMNRELDRITEEKRAKRQYIDPVEEDLGWILRLGLHSDIMRDFCADARILSLIEEIVRPGIAIYAARLVTKEPLDSTVCNWHQDDVYWIRNSLSETRMSVWVALQDTSIEQGCLQVIPGTHKQGLQPFRDKAEGTCNKALDVEIDLSKRVYLPVKAGTAILFSALLWHGSDGNSTPHRRRAFIVTYQEATCSAGSPMQWKILRPAQ